MRRVVVKVHLAVVRVLSVDVLVELCHFSEILDVLLGVAEVLVHNLTTVLHHFDVRVPHVEENRRSLNHQTNLYAEQVSRKGRERPWVIVELLTSLVPCVRELLCGTFNVFTHIMLIDIASFDAHFL